MGVTCQILIKKSREGVYKPGRAVAGAVKFAVDEPTEYQDVTLSFLGKGKCRWKEGSGKNSTTFIGTEDFVCRHVNVTNKPPDEPITLHGVYEHPFEFYIPEDIPTSYNETSYPIGSIVYCVQLKLVQTSFFSFNKVFTAEVPVYGYIDWRTSDGVSAADQPVVFGLEKVLFAPFAVEKPVIHLKAEAEKACLTPGENVQLSYKVTNNSDVAIESVQLDLYRYITYTSNHGRTRTWGSKIRQCEVQMPGVPGRQGRSFTCAVPTLPDLYTIQCSKIIARQYRVRVTLRLPMPYRNATVELPVAVGERAAAAGSALDADDALEPPSYWEAMTEADHHDKGAEKP